MQQFKALFKKEIGAYFKSYFAYIIFFVYLFVSVGVAFYFGAYLSAHDSSMYALFYAQPIILLVLLPAVTMKTWSDEYRSGTAEFLLTLPLHPAVPVLAKVAAAWCLCFGMSLFLLPFVFYTATWLHLDVGNLMTDFIGLWLVMAFLTALGCLISSCSRNVVIAYVFSVLVMAMWVVFPFSGFYNTYNNFLFGEIGVPDVLYFALFTAAFLLVNVLVPEFMRSIQKYKIIKFAGFMFFLLVGISAVSVMMNNLISYKFDATTARFYTPSAETKAVVNHVYKPIKIELYAAKNYIYRNNEYFYYYQQIKRFLRKYESMSEGMIRLSVNEVEPFSPLEDNILDNGLFYETDKDGSRNYLGAVVRDEESHGVIIKQFLAERRVFLEKDINMALIHLTRAAVTKNLGVYLEPTQNLEQYQGFMLNLENDYNVVDIPSSIYEISSDIEMVILINPKDLPDTFIYAVDQFVMRGGKLLIFADFYTEAQPELTNLAPVKILPLLQSYYFEFGDKLVHDGVLNPEFAVEDKGVAVNGAFTYKFSNPSMNVTPFITHDDEYIGALLVGAVPSMFGQTPYTGLGTDVQIPEHQSVSIGEATVAVIGDVDLIEDYLWMDERSPDRNPYSVISKNDNLNAVRRLIDTMLGNDIFNRQPIYHANNSQDIAKQVDRMVYEPYAETLQKLNNEIDIKRMSLYAVSGKDENKADAMQKIEQAGQQLSKLEKQVDGLVYRVKKAYTHKINMMILLNVLVFPFLFTLIIGLLTVLTERRYRRFIKGLGYEK